MSLQGLTVTLTTTAVSLVGASGHGVVKVIVRNRGIGTRQAEMGGGDRGRADLPDMGWCRRGRSRLRGESQPAPSAP